MIRLRLESERDRALDIEERLGPGAFGRLPRREGQTLRALRDACDARHDGADPERAAIAWRGYAGELEARFADPQTPELIDALRRVHGSERSLRLGLPNQRYAATMVAFTRRFEAGARLEFDGALLLARLPSIDGGIVAERRFDGFRWTAGACITRRPSRLHVAPVKSWLPASGPLPADRAYARAFREEGPGSGSLSIDARCAMLRLDAREAAPQLDLDDGMAVLRWRHDHREVFDIALALIRGIQRALVAPSVPPPPAQRARRYRRWPPPARRSS